MQSEFYSFFITPILYRNQIFLKNLVSDLFPKPIFILPFYHYHVERNFLFFDKVELVFLALGARKLNDPIIFYLTLPSSGAKINSIKQQKILILYP